MRKIATHPHPSKRTYRVCASAWLLAMVLLLGTSQYTLAQDARVLQDYQRLGQALEEAKEAHATNPTSYSLEILNQAVDTFKRFEQANSRAIEQAQRLNAPLHAQGAGGPDAFGYTYSDSNEPNGPTYSFVDISNTGAVVTSGDDTSSGPIALGAPFDFYGTTYSSLVMATNGYISTDPTDTGPDLSNDCPLPASPSTGGGARLYPLHDDLVTKSGLYQYFASCPHPNISGGCSVFQ